MATRTLLVPDSDSSSTASDEDPPSPPTNPLSKLLCMYGLAKGASATFNAGLSLPLVYYLVDHNVDAATVSLVLTLFSAFAAGSVLTARSETVRLIADFIVIVACALIALTIHHVPKMILLVPLLGLGRDASALLRAKTEELEPNELDQLNAHIGVVTNAGQIFGLLCVLIYKTFGFGITLSVLTLLASAQPIFTIRCLLKARAEQKELDLLPAKMTKPTLLGSAIALWDKEPRIHNWFGFWVWPNKLMQTEAITDVMEHVKKAMTRQVMYIGILHGVTNGIVETVVYLFQAEYVGVPEETFSATLIFANVLTILIGHFLPRCGGNFGISAVGIAVVLQVLALFFLYTTPGIPLALACQIGLELGADTQQMSIVRIRDVWAPSTVPSADVFWMQRLTQLGGRTVSAYLATTIYAYHPRAPLAVALILYLLSKLQLDGSIRIAEHFMSTSVMSATANLEEVELGETEENAAISNAIHKANASIKNPATTRFSKRFASVIEDSENYVRELDTHIAGYHGIHKLVSLLVAYEAEGGDLHALFANLDEDRNGHVSADELHRNLKKYWECFGDIKLAEYRLMVEQLDHDASKTLTIGEILAAVEKFKTAEKAARHETGSDESGEIEALNA